MFDATAANIEVRVQRMNLPEGINVTLLPKKTRGQEVQLVLTLRYGNEENLKGYEAAAGLLPPLMLREARSSSATSNCATSSIGSAPRSVPVEVVAEAAKDAADLPWPGRQAH